MKKPMLFFALAFAFISAKSQVGIGTNTPNTTLDIRGSLAANSRNFSSTESVGVTDYTLLFTGTSAATLTLPNAINFPGRIIHIKNTRTSAVPVLTIATTAAQTIDGNTTWSLDDPNESVNVVSDGQNWKIVGQSLPSGSGSAWSLGGNNMSTTQSLGTVNAYDLPFITSNQTRMTISNTGNIGIGSSSFDPAAPEKLMIDAGVTGSYNLIGAYGERAGYLQFNIQNTSSSGTASTDIVATANNGTETTNYVDLGINSSQYNNGTSSLLNGANNAYLYSKGEDFIIGNASTSKSMIFFTGGDAPANEKFRLNSNGMIVKSDFLPSSNNSGNIGNSSFRWANAYINTVTTTSDARLKTNITDLPYSLNEVIKMRPVVYNWKETPLGESKIGFLAQDLRKIVPEVVVGDEAKENLGVNYTELIPVLVNAIKEQQKQIDELKKQVAELKSK